MTKVNTKTVLLAALVVAAVTVVVGAEDVYAFAYKSFNSSTTDASYG